MSTAAMEVKRMTNGGKEISAYTMKVKYIKSVWKCGGKKLVSEWTFRGDNYLKAFQEQYKYVEEFEALAHQLMLENDNVKFVRIYNNQLPPGESIMYGRDPDGTLIIGAALPSYFKTTLKNKGLL